MSDIEKVIEDPKRTIKQKCAECIKGPRNLIKTLIIFVCVVVVLQQISACVKKLIVTPITTYTHFDFNKTLMYPSVTFCREPPYKFGKMLEYGLYAHPRFSSRWRSFDFANVSLDEFWDDVTFNQTDMFLQAGLSGLEENVRFTSTMGFTHGRCYTMSPNILTTEAHRDAGYAVTLQHTAEDIDKATGINPPGYYIFIHYYMEPFTEVTVYNGGLVDTLYVNVGETLEVKLKVDQYMKISSEDDPCTTQTNYSTNACTTQHVFDLIGDAIGCSAPFMESTLPRCDNFTTITTLMTNYTNTYKTHNSDVCPRTCNSYLYTGYVTDRQKFYTWNPGTKTWIYNSVLFESDSGVIGAKSSVNLDASALQTHLYIYFNSMMVSVYEERYNYDWNLFVSDIGGSVGFLLGLSVIGLLEVFGKTCSIFVAPFIKHKKTSSRNSVTSSDTADVKTRQEYIDEWNPKIVD